MAVRGKHGAMLAGRYRLLEQLGEGGMGSVWKAEHVLLHSLVAIKIIDPDVARLEFNLARFLREAKTLATLRSPNVVQVLDFGSDADTPYLVMELLEGQTLGRRLTERGRLSLREMSRIMNDVCTAMSLVHEQGLIHRDLKPDNIFLCNNFLAENGERRVTKVVDFGIAKSLRGDMSASMKTRTGHMLGTPSYMSPEQCRGLKDIDHRADLWALGVITYECLVGKVPFEGEVLGDLLLRICMDPLPIPSRNVLDVEVKGSLPPAFDAWFAKAVARDRAERHQSAAELASSLAELASSVGAARPAARDGAVREALAREGLEPSRPSLPRVSPVPSVVAVGAASGAPARAPSATPRQPVDTETNTTIGLVGAALKVDRRARALAVSAVVLSAALGLWAIGDKRAAGGAESVEVRNLRPPYEVEPKTLRRGVPSGRPWHSESDPARPAFAPERNGAGFGASDPLTGTGAASALSPGAVVANVAPGIPLPPGVAPDGASATGEPSSSAAAPAAAWSAPAAAGAPASPAGATSGALPSGALPLGALPSGAPLSGAPLSGAPASAGTPAKDAASAPPVAPPSGSGQRGFGSAAPSDSSAGRAAPEAPAPPAAPAPEQGSPTPPPRALRGTAAPAPRAREASDTGIRRVR